MSSPLRAWWALSGSERSKLLFMLIGLPSISLMLHLAGYVRTRRWIERMSPLSTSCTVNAADIKAAERLAQLAEIAGRRGAIAATCLRQSLLVYGWLRWQGFDPELKIGVLKPAAGLDAHAWVEFGGRPLACPQLRHTPFQQVGEAGSTKP